VALCEREPEVEVAGEKVRSPRSPPLYCFPYFPFLVNKCVGYEDEGRMGVVGRNILVISPEKRS
jgi:hypothetical protein